MERLCKVQKLKTAYALAEYLAKGMAHFELTFTVVTPRPDEYEVWSVKVLRQVEKRDIVKLIRNFTVTYWRDEHGDQAPGDIRRT